MKIIYPELEAVIKYNALILDVLAVKKGDKAVVLSKAKIRDALEGCKGLEGDLYEKAVLLLKKLVKGHPFASGNRRTAFIVTKEFVTTNRGEFNIEDDPKNARVLQGIRENFYTDKEIKEWIVTGDIRGFKR